MDLLDLVGHADPGVKLSGMVPILSRRSQVAASVVHVAQVPVVDGHPFQPPKILLDRQRLPVHRLGLVQISDEATIEAAIDKVKAANAKQLGEYRSGKEKLFGYFAGQVMRETKGQANPQLLNELLKRKLKE